MNMKEGHNIGRPPILEGSNNAYGKTRMKVFLKAIDESACQAVKKGWKAPTIVVEGAIVNLSVDKWSDDHHKVANGNSKAMRYSDC